MSRGLGDVYKRQNLEYLVIDCLWYREHPSHLNLDKSLRLIDTLSPKKAILTNLHSDLDYNELKKKMLMLKNFVKLILI